MLKRPILDLIGKTPLVPFDLSEEGVPVTVLMKLEYMNPSGSIKDRMAYRIITDAMDSGVLKPGCTVVEASTGNTGIALSFVGSVLGLPVVIYETIPGRMGECKRKIMKDFGVDVRLVPAQSQVLGNAAKGVEPETAFPGRNYCLELERAQGNYWWARQFSNPSNPLAYHQTGQEILEQARGKVDIFVASIGSGGTLKGVAEVLREANPQVRIVGVQPAHEKEQLWPPRPFVRNEVDGGILADLLETSDLVDDVVRVTDQEAVEMTRRLRRAGFTCGNSSGANVLVAMKEAKAHGGTVVTVLPDHANRYDSVADEHYTT